MNKAMSSWNEIESVASLQVRPSSSFSLERKDLDSADGKRFSSPTVGKPAGEMTSQLKEATDCHLEKKNGESTSHNINESNGVSLSQRETSQQSLTDEWRDDEDDLFFRTIMKAQPLDEDEDDDEDNLPQITSPDIPSSPKANSYKHIFAVEYSPRSVMRSPSPEPYACEHLQLPAEGYLSPSKPLSQAADHCELDRTFGGGLPPIGFQSESDNDEGELSDGVCILEDLDQSENVMILPPSSRTLLVRYTHKESTSHGHTSERDYERGIDDLTCRSLCHQLQHTFLNKEELSLPATL